MNKDELAAHETCKRCGHENPAWSAPSPLWNEVMRGGCINGPPEYGDMVCAACFMVLAEAKGVASLFRVSAERVTAPLQTITPTGRVWDEASQLWSEQTSSALQAESGPPAEGGELIAKGKGLCGLLESSAKAFRENPVYSGDGDPVFLVVQAAEMAEAAAHIRTLEAENEGFRRLAAENAALEVRVGETRSQLQRIVDHRDATSELHTSADECADTMADIARQALERDDG